jgi:DNA-binding NtrC family response regulator
MTFDGDPFSVPRRLRGSTREVLLDMVDLLRLMKSELEALDSLGTELTLSIALPMDFYEQVERFEIDLIQTALRNTGGHQKRAAVLLGMQASTLNIKIKRYGIDVPLFRRSLLMEMDAGR